MGSAALLLSLLAILTVVAAEPAPEPAPVAAEAPTPTPPVERWLDGVVLLVTGPAWCAGVVIDDQGTVATAYHCVATGRRPQVRTRAGERLPGRVEARSQRDDLALISVPDLAGRAVPLPVRTTGLAIGERVWALGHPFAPQAETSPLLAGTLQWSASQGVVSAVGERLVQVDAALNPGNSGGPVVDDTGAIVGIASRRLSADNVAFISPAPRLAALREDPRRRALGGTWGVSLAALQGLGVADVPAVGLTIEAALRDRAILEGALYFPVGQRWTALGLGEASWVTAELGAVARARAGRGRWSTTLDLGASALLVEGIEGRIEDGGLDLWARPASVRPALVVGLGLGGSALRLLASPDDGELGLLLGIDLGFPGVLGTF